MINTLSVATIFADGTSITISMISAYCQTTLSDLSKWFTDNKLALNLYKNYMTINTILPNIY
jgi:hypothetical protein